MWVSLSQRISANTLQNEERNHPSKDSSDAAAKADGRDVEYSVCGREGCRPSFLKALGYQTAHGSNRRGILIWIMRILPFLPGREALTLHITGKEKAHSFLQHHHWHWCWPVPALP